MRTIFLLLILNFLPAISYAQRFGEKMISTDVRVTKGLSYQYQPLVVKAGLTFITLPVLKAHGYLTGEINPKGFSAAGHGYKINFFQIPQSRSLFLILDLKFLLANKNFFSTTSKSIYTLFCPKMGAGYMLTKRMAFELGVSGTTNHTNGNLFFNRTGLSYEAGVCFYFSGNFSKKGVRVPGRYKKPKNQLKCP